MMRKLIVPLVAAGLLAGCVTSGYSYRGGDGDYYYGRPSTQYRYHGPYGAYPYGGFGYYGYYGDPYYSRHPFYGRYGYPYYGHPYYYRPPVVIRPRPDNDPAPGSNDDNDRRPPWRDLVDRRRRQLEGGGNLAPMPAPQRATQPMPTISRGDDGGSRMERIMQRSQERARSRGTSEVEP